MLNFQKTRTVLFILSVILFFVGLPFILTFALGYKFDPRTMKFIKTGLIFVKTQPSGAKVYLNNKLIPEKTPASMQELLPGTYRVRLELMGHYSWKSQVEVEAGKVSRIDKVILFPLRPNLQQLNQERFSSFRVHPAKRLIYYLDQEMRVLYRSDLEAGNFEDVASLPEKFPGLLGWEVSADLKKMFIFSAHQINVIFIDNQTDYEYLTMPVLFDYPQEKIINVFWHSDSYHLVVLTDKHVQVAEARPAAVPVNLVELNKAEASSVYDTKTDTLYFSDAQKSPEGVLYNNLYKLELNVNLDSLDKIVLKPFSQLKLLPKDE